MNCGAIPSGEVWSPRPMGARSTVGRDDVGIVPYETMTRNVAHNTADAKVSPVPPGQHKRRARRGWRRRDYAKARCEFCSAKFAWLESSGSCCILSAKRIPKPWFWRRSFLPFFCRRKKGSRRRHKNRSAGGNGSPRPRSALAMTGFFHELRCNSGRQGVVTPPYGGQGAR